MKILVSLSAVTKAKGDKVVVKLGKDQWYAGEITTVSRDGTSVTVLFNDGDKGKFKPIEAKLIGVKGKKTAYSDTEAKILIDKYKEKSSKPPATVKPPKPPAPPVTVKPPKPAPPIEAEPPYKPPKLPELPTGPTEVSMSQLQYGDVIRWNGSEFFVVEVKIGTKKTSIKMTKTSDNKPYKLQGANWISKVLRISSGRKGSGAIQEAEQYTQPHRDLADKRNERKENWKQHITDLGVKVGSIVQVRWSNISPTEEEVIDINWQTGKVAIKRRGYYADRYQKRRFIPASAIIKVVS